MGARAGLAQLVERFSCKEDVVGSNPTPGSRGPAGPRLILRILVVTNAYPAPERPAYGIYVARLVAALEREGHEVAVAASDEEGGGWRSLRKYARLALRARSAVRSHPPDVIWGHYLVPTGSIARHAARSAHVPYALTAHGTDVANAERSPRIRKATLKALGDACAVFAVSDDLAVRLEAVAGPLGDRLHIVSAGIDLEAFVDGDAEVAAAALGWDSDGPRVAFVGNLIPRKNVARLLAAFATARAEWGGGSLAIAGDGPLMAELVEIAGALGIRDHVRFAGAVSPADVPRWVRACDVACLVSLREGFGLAAIEALACGTPVVASARSAVAEIVGPGCGALAHDTEDGFVRATRTVLDVDRQVSRQAASARAELFPWSNAIDGMLAALGA